MVKDDVVGTNPVDLKCSSMSDQHNSTICHPDSSEPMLGPAEFDQSAATAKIEKVVPARKKCRGICSAPGACSFSSPTRNMRLRNLSVSFRSFSSGIGSTGGRWLGPGSCQQLDLLFSLTPNFREIVLESSCSNDSSGFNLISVATWFHNQH